MIRRVLHPTDFSRASGAAFSRALAEARANKAALTIVHVLAPVVPIAGDGYVSASVYDQMAAASRAWGQRQLNRLLARARTARVRARGLLLEGVAHQQIVRAARRQRADLVVLGTHGRTGVARFFLGSVAARVTATAPCPVLTVRGRAT
jgi:nucleotide-binding universal stress UspA family protein